MCGQTSVLGGDTILNCEPTSTPTTSATCYTMPAPTPATMATTTNQTNTACQRQHSQDGGRLQIHENIVDNSKVGLALVGGYT